VATRELDCTGGGERGEPTEEVAVVLVPNLEGI